MFIVITGATKGIGRAIATCLAEEGHQIALCARTASDLEEMKVDLLGLINCDNVLINTLDVRDRASIIQFGETVLKEFGHIDVLINNAGVFIPGMINDEEADTFDLVMETNLHSAYFLTKTFLPSMIHRRKGHIINLCSVAGIQGYPNGGSYAISKHALVGFGKTLREEVRQFGIRVTNILPGATWTDSWEGVDLPKDRLMSSRDVARVVKAAIELDENAVMEEVILRPIQGDL